MAPTGNGSVKKGLVAVVTTVAATLILTGIFSWARIAALEEQVKNQGKWIEETRTELGAYRRENNDAHLRIQAEIKESGDSTAAKLDEVLKAVRK